MIDYLEIYTALSNKVAHPYILDDSINVVGEVTYFAITDGKENFPGLIAKSLEGFDVKTSISVDGNDIAILEKNHNNCKKFAEALPWMKPIARFNHKYSFGLGDRLGLASNAHVRLFKGKGVLPVLAQQSIRELNLTGRTFTDVLDSAAWAVFEEGYRDGYSADGDHLKNAFEVDYAVKCGFPMLTLDCSEHINNDVEGYSQEVLKEQFLKISPELRAYFENEYLDKKFDLSNSVSVAFDSVNLMQSVLIFNDAIEYAKIIHERFVAPNKLDLEVSIDETLVPTTPENHFFIANELHKAKVVVQTMAPRFHGEFQKGIDYRGNMEQFSREYIVHEAIARHFGYRLSIHSGSDKFSVFPIIGNHSDKGWHVKTAGTNWLEALRVIADKNPSLMIEIYKFALENLEKAKAYYHIDGTVENSIQVETVTIENVSKLLNDDMTRQVLHVTYGLILNHKVDNKLVFKNDIYDTLKINKDVYAEYLNKHINKHLSLLGK